LGKNTPNVQEQPPRPFPRRCPAGSPRLFVGNLLGSTADSSEWCREKDAPRARCLFGPDTFRHRQGNHHPSGPVESSEDWDVHILRIHTPLASAQPTALDVNCPLSSVWNSSDKALPGGGFRHLHPSKGPLGLTNTAITAACKKREISHLVFFVLFVSLCFILFFSFCLSYSVVGVPFLVFFVSIQKRNVQKRDKPRSLFCFWDTSTESGLDVTEVREEGRPHLDWIGLDYS
jgi:hypothetical protein